MANTKTKNDVNNNNIGDATITNSNNNEVIREKDNNDDDDDNSSELFEWSKTSDVRHKNPLDRHLIHVWVIEEPTSGSGGGVLTQDGITQIAHHAYVPGTYTTLDNLFNPFWTYLTELLPRTIAPNMISTIGGIHCCIAYIITWIYGTSNYDSNVDTTTPNWIFLFNGYCMFVYYTMDCMDGKQARRIGASSPLGQLFDHGVDCLILQFPVSLCLYVVMTGGKWYLVTLGFLQMTFFVAQWEEYYTGSLPHSTGNIGVTEVNYGLALWSFCNAFVDRKKLYNVPLQELLPTSVYTMFEEPFQLYNYQKKHLMMISWYASTLLLMILSVRRVMVHLQQKTDHQTITKYHYNSQYYVQMSALSKLVSPFLIAFVGPIGLLPYEVTTNELRWISLATGFAMTIITNKIIVFSMAKQAYASIQYVDVLPIMVSCLWVKYDKRLTPMGINLLFQLLTIWFIIRILYWTKITTNQICQRLDIYLLTIKHPKKE